MIAVFLILAAVKIAFHNIFSFRFPYALFALALFLLSSLRKICDKNVTTILKKRDKKVFQQ